MENLKSWDFGASNLSGTEAFENGAKDPITQGECMGVHNMSSFCWKAELEAVSSSSLSESTSWDSVSAPCSWTFLR